MVSVNIRNNPQTPGELYWARTSDLYSVKVALWTNWAKHPNIWTIAMRLFSLKKSGWLDSNQRPLRPERSTLPDCATSRQNKYLNKPLAWRKTSRGDWIRTSDHQHPMLIRYRAALHPELSVCVEDVWVWNKIIIGERKFIFFVVTQNKYLT